MSLPRLSYRLQRSITVLVLLVATSSVFWALWRQQQHALAVNEQTLADQRLFSFTDPNAVSQLVLTHAQNETFTITRDVSAPSVWRITSHRGILAEATAIEAMLRSALDLRCNQTMTPTKLDTDGAPDLSIFGLKPPRFTLTLMAQARPDTAVSTQTLAVGNKNNFDGSLYVQRQGSATVALIPAAFVYQIDRDLYKLRDKRVAIFTPETVDSFTQAATPFGPGYHIVRDAQGFAIQTPLQVAADPEAVHGLLNALATMRGKRVVAEDASQTHLSVYGLQTPRFDVTLNLHDTNSIRLFFGEIQLQGATHAFARQDTIDGPIWELDSDWPLQKLRQQATELRDLHVLHVDSQQVHRISLRQNSQTMTFVQENDAPHDVRRWIIANAPEQQVHSSLVAALVHKVTQLKADKIVAEQPTPDRIRALHLHHPALEIDLLDAGDHLLGSLLVASTSSAEVFVTTDKKRRIDQISSQQRDALALPFTTYLHQDAVTEGEKPSTP